MCVTGIVEYASVQPYCVYPGGHAAVVLLCVYCTVEVGWREREREGGKMGGGGERSREREREKPLSDLQPGQNPVCCNKKKVFVHEMRFVLFTMWVPHDMSCDMSQFCMKPC